MAEHSVENVDEENSVTMLDVLKEENQLEEDAYAVLGASDDRNCTYNKGYIRQALYACKTCCPDKTRGGVCLACSFHCHEGHELVELYTKRHFRCDCGNAKFGDKKCSLDPTKPELNKENQYNQNFDGNYCTCARPYPDPEDTNNDEMLQCVVCEDWYHSKHLGCTAVPEADAYDEMVCAGCMKKHTFLWKYASKYSAMKNTNKEVSGNNEEKIDVEGISKCCTMPETSLSPSEGGCFWTESWRSALCTCETCKKSHFYQYIDCNSNFALLTNTNLCKCTFIVFSVKSSEMYEEDELMFLLDPMDSVQAYEEAGKSGQRESQYERGMKALASLDHVQQLTAIEEYNNMKERLKEYLQKFAENKKVVREEDIKEFFSGMEARKRPRVVVPTFCR